MQATNLLAWFILTQYPKKEKKFALLYSNKTDL